ncbi:hypothetical protein ACQZ40_22885 [Agrobacterium sp. 16-172Ci]
MEGKVLGQPGDLSLERVFEILQAIFSAIVLTAIAVIISGKLVAATTIRSDKEDDFFTINLVFFRIRATGDEVMWGFTVFIFTMGLTVTLGGQPAYHFFRLNTGLDIGHWSSLCAIAAFFSVVASVLLWIVVPFLRSTPVISVEDREAQINKLNAQRSADMDQGND